MLCFEWGISEFKRKGTRREMDKGGQVIFKEEEIKGENGWVSGLWYLIWLEKKKTWRYSSYIFYSRYMRKNGSKRLALQHAVTPHCQWETDLESCYFMVKGLNIDYCIQGGRMFFSLVSRFQTAAVLHKHLGVSNTKKPDMIELNKKHSPLLDSFQIFFTIVHRHSCAVF